MAEYDSPLTFLKLYNNHRKIGCGWETGSSEKCHLGLHERAWRSWQRVRRLVCRGFWWLPLFEYLQWAHSRILPILTHRRRSGAVQLLIDLNQDPDLREYIDVFPAEFDLGHQLADKWFVVCYNLLFFKRIDFQRKTHWLHMVFEKIATEDLARCNLA